MSVYDNAKVSGRGDELSQIWPYLMRNLSRKWSSKACSMHNFRRASLPRCRLKVHDSPLSRNEQRCEMGRSGPIHVDYPRFCRPASLRVLARRCATAAATAQGVALNASAGCSNGNLDITLTTVGANREGWRATNAAGSDDLPRREGLRGSPNFSGTFTGFQIVFSPSQPAGTLRSPRTPTSARRRRSPATPPSSSSSTTARRARSCCPATVRTEPVRRPPSMRLPCCSPKIPAQGPLALMLTAVLVAGSRRTRPFPPRARNAAQCSRQPHTLVTRGPG